MGWVFVWAAVALGLAVVGLIMNTVLHEQDTQRRRSERRIQGPADRS
jgi:heme exporter protein D